MPLYEYECKKCRRHTDRIEKLSGPHLKKCLHCGGKVERVLAPTVFHFKGSGWYVTDYARKSAGGGEASKVEKTTGGDSAGAGEAKGKEAGSKETGSKETKTTKKK